MAKLCDFAQYISRGKSPKYVDESHVRVISQACIYWAGINYSKVKFHDESSSFDKGLLQNGDVLINSTGTGTLGRAAVFVNPDNDTYIADSHVTIMRCNEKLDPVFLTYFLSSPITQDEIYSKCVNGSTNQIELSKEKLSALFVNFPDLPIQRRIAATLDKVSEGIAVCRQMLADLDEMVKARFVEMFGDPFLAPKYFSKKLKDIAITISDGSNVPKECYETAGPVLFLRIQNVWFNEFRLDDSVYISDDVNTDFAETSLLHGDLLMTKIGRYYTKDSSLGRVSVYLGEDNKANYSNNIMRIRMMNSVSSEYVNALMNLDDYNQYIRKVSVGGTDKRALSKAVIGDLPILVPPTNLQNEFVGFVHQINKSKSVVQQQLAELETLKKSLMQEYF